MVTLKGAFKRFLQGNTKTAVFALTTQCNCQCMMCDMHRKPPTSISLSNAKKVLDFLTDHKFLVVYFTGGEPTLHPNVVDIVQYADTLGLVTTMTTNGTAQKKLLLRLKKAGLYLLSVSLDHWNPQICEKIRNHRNIMDKQVQALNYLKKIGLKTYALAFLNPFLVHDGVEKLVDYANNVLKVPFGFCYPTKSEINSYKLGGKLTDAQLSQRMESSVQKIVYYKMNGRNIANLWVYMDDILNFEKKASPNFYCKGGKDVIYIDWLGDVYPCFLKKKMFNILNDDPQFISNAKCNDCLINCFREPSVLPQFLYSPNLLAMEIRYSHSDRWIYG